MTTATGPGAGAGAPATDGSGVPPLRLHRTGRFVLESGEALPEVVQAYRLYGELDAARDNLVVLFHSLTGDTRADRWWAGAVGPGRAIEAARHAVLCVNLLGSCYGTTGLPGVRGVTPAELTEGDAAGPTAGPPADPPLVTTRDQARLAARLVEDLGVGSVALASGGSLGGMVALEWAATYPALTRAVVAFAAPAAHPAQATAWNHIQRETVRLGEARGLALARMAAMLTYRTAEELDARFGRARREDGLWQAASYLEHQGEKLVERFDPASYIALTRTMDAHDVGRGRGGVVAALRRFEGRLVAVGIRGDLLYPEPLVRAWAAAAGAEYRTIESTHGHDAFLLEPAQVGAILAEALEQTGAAPAAARRVS